MEEYKFQTETFANSKARIFITPDFAKINVRNYTSLSKGKESAIIRHIQIHKDSKLLEDFLMYNWNMIFDIAKPIYSKYPKRKDEILMEGFAKAVELVYKFNVKESNKFYSYAKTGILNHLKRYINDSALIKKPYLWKQEFDKLNITRGILSKQEGSYTIEQLAETSGISLERITELESNFMPLMSLDKLVEDSKHDNYNRFASSYNVEAEVENKDSSHYLEMIIMKKMGYKKSEVFFERIGFRDGVKKSLESTGKKYGITKERVRQIMMEVKNKLENNKELLIYSSL